MPADPASEGMKVVRYVDLYPWTKDPDSLVLTRRDQVVDPKPTDCIRLRVEITIGKKWFAPLHVDGAGKVTVVESEIHDGVDRPEGYENAPEPLNIPV